LLRTLWERLGLHTGLRKALSGKNFLQKMDISSRGQK